MKAFVVLPQRSHTTCGGGPCPANTTVQSNLSTAQLVSQLYALPNVCPHQFGPLCAGTVNGTMACSAETGWRFAWVREGEIVTCPWHGIEFDITTGRSLASPRLRVRTYPVIVEDGQIKVTV